MALSPQTAAPAADQSLPDVAALPFETALAELERIVDQLEKGAVGLDESIALYERGEALKAHCAKLLDDAEARIEKISLGADGRPSGVEPLDVD
ncbi:exodeoxyribonuclease VII small subunit [Methylocella sp.]|uniref:exodeoxyribonuclease VII small subunit n=1 Tax=Methylocella sp. TaxID=1978226 RepID=UPI0035B16A96